MKEALEKSGIKDRQYFPTVHAIERLVVRFGISERRARQWFNDFMKKAEYLTETHSDNSIYVNDGIQAVVNESKRRIITIYNTTSTDFLRPVLEREIRKIQRESTSRIRATEKRLAEAYADLAERMMNFANARNPKTRELIKERAREKESQISDLKRSIERQEDEMQAKIRAIELIAE